MGDGTSPAHMRHTKKLPTNSASSGDRCRAKDVEAGPSAPKSSIWAVEPLADGGGSGGFPLAARRAASSASGRSDVASTRNLQNVRWLRAAATCHGVSPACPFPRDVAAWASLESKCVCVCVCVCVERLRGCGGRESVCVSVACGEHPVIRVEVRTYVVLGFPFSVSNV
jgi:hypothetical protein